ncbi:MAG: hypothetical protein ABEK59_03240 [Halobacteria archaeon]
MVDKPEKREVLDHLYDSVSRGQEFFRSKKIAESTELSSKQVGVYLGLLRDEVEDLEIEKWSRSRSTTWRVARVDGA